MSVVCSPCGISHEEELEAATSAVAVVSAGSDLVCTSGYTELHHALRSCGSAAHFIKTIKDLLTSPEGRRSTRVQSREGGWTPLHLSCRSIAPDDTILSIAHADPWVITVQDEEGDTVLHSAFRYGVSENVQRALIKLAPRKPLSASPSVFSTPDYAEGDLPIHCAIRHDTPLSTIKSLLDAFPHSIEVVNHEGQTPLHLACDLERHDIIAAIAETMISLLNGVSCMAYIGAEDRSGLTPLVTLWTSYLEAAGECVEDVECSWFDPSTFAQSPEQRELWASLTLLITCAFYGRKVDLEDEHLLLRATVGLGGGACPASLLKFVAKRHPSALSKQNENGQTPLHEGVLVSSSHHALLKMAHSRTLVEEKKGKDEIEGKSDRAHSELNDEERQDGKAEKNPDTEVRDAASEANVHDNVVPDLSPSMLQILVEAYPQAARTPDKRGRLPLHLAVESCISWEDGSKQIFEAAPDALRVKDKETGLFPFMLAATASEENDVTATDRTYRLLRHAPDLVASGIVPAAAMCNPKKKKKKTTTTTKKKKKKKKRQALPIKSPQQAKKHKP